MPLNLKSIGGGGVILNPASTPIDVTLTIPASSGTLLTAEGMAGAAGAAGVGYLPSGTGAVATTVQGKLRESVSVKDKGADSTGIVDASTAFTNAGTEAYLVTVPSGTYKLNTTPVGRFLLMGGAVLTGPGALACKAVRMSEMPYFSTVDSNQSYKGVKDQTSSIFVLGDSITAGSGASSYPTSYAFMLARSLLNGRNYGFNNDTGAGYHTDINQSSAVYYGYSSTGTLSATGITGNRRSLAAGQSITITQRQFNTAYVVYDGSLSTGSLVIAKNGTTLSTQAVSGTSLNNTSAVTSFFNEGDSLTITASGGTVVVCGVITLKTAQSVSLIHVSGQSGTAYQDYTTTAAMNEIGYWLNLFRSGSEKLLVLALGTNNMYNAGKALSPTAMISQITTLIAGISSRCTTIKFALSVPPKADETTFPQQAGYTYYDYVDAIVEYAYANGYGVIRNDKSALSRATSYYGDGVHPDNYGHRIMAQTFCDALGVSYNPYIRTVTPTTVDSQAAIVYNSTWGSFASIPAQAHINGNIVTLSGIVQPNGSVSTTLGALPAGFRPLSRTIYLVGRSDAGPVGLSIDISGNIILSAVPATWFSLEGISFAMSRS